MEKNNEVESKTSKNKKKPGFLNIPREVLNSNLSIYHKVVFAEIIALCSIDKKGHCNPTNAHFAKLLSIDPKNVYSIITDLKQLGCITTFVNAANGNERTIYYKKMIDPSPQLTYTLTADNVDPIRRQRRGIRSLRIPSPQLTYTLTADNVQITTDTNTYINTNKTTAISTLDKYSEIPDEKAAEVFTESNPIEKAAKAMFKNKPTETKENLPLLKQTAKPFDFMFAETNEKGKVELIEEQLNQEDDSAEEEFIMPTPIAKEVKSSTIDWNSDTPF